MEVGKFARPLPGTSHARRSSAYSIFLCQPSGSERENLKEFGLRDGRMKSAGDHWRCCELELSPRLQVTWRWFRGRCRSKLDHKFSVIIQLANFNYEA